MTLRDRFARLTGRDSESRFIRAFFARDIATLKQLVADGLDINTPRTLQRGIMPHTPLEWVMKPWFDRDSHIFALALVEMGADPAHPFCHAIENGVERSHTMLHALLDAKAVPTILALTKGRGQLWTIADSQGRTPLDRLVDATRNGHHHWAWGSATALQMLTAALKAGADPLAPNGHGESLLDRARAGVAFPAELAGLVEAAATGGDIDAAIAQAEKDIALIKAYGAGQPDAMEQALATGANPDLAFDTQGQRHLPIFVRLVGATDPQSRAMLKVLLAHGPRADGAYVAGSRGDANGTTLVTETALHKAVSTDDGDTIDALTARDPGLWNIKDSDGATPLHRLVARLPWRVRDAASAQAASARISHLLSLGADPHIRDKADQSVIDLALNNPAMPQGIAAIFGDPPRRQPRPRLPSPQ